MAGDDATRSEQLGSVIEVAAGLVFHHGKLLIAQRYPEAHLGGLWEFPGGKRHPGETFNQCLVRELIEELGIEVEPIEVFDRITHAYPQKTVHLEFIVCRWLRGEAQALGCADFAWVTADEITACAFPAADEQVLAELRARPEMWQRYG